MRGLALTWRFGRGRMCRLRGMQCSSHLHTGAVVGLQLTSWESYHCEHVTLNNRITVAQGFAGLSIRGCNGPNGPRMSGNLSTSSGGNIRSVPIAFALSLPSARWSSVGATNVGVSTSSQGFGDLSLDAAGNTYVLFRMPPTTFPSLVWPVSSVAEKTSKRRALRRELNRRSMLTYALRQDFVRSLEALL